MFEHTVDGARYEPRCPRCGAEPGESSISGWVGPAWIDPNRHICSFCRFRWRPREIVHVCPKGDVHPHQVDASTTLLVTLPAGEGLLDVTMPRDRERGVTTFVACDVAEVSFDELAAIAVRLAHRVGHAFKSLRHAAWPAGGPLLYGRREWNVGDAVTLFLCPFSRLVDRYLARQFGLPLLDPRRPPGLFLEVLLVADDAHVAEACLAKRRQELGIDPSVPPGVTVH